MPACGCMTPVAYCSVPALSLPCSFMPGTAAAAMADAQFLPTPAPTPVPVATVLRQPSGEASLTAALAPTPAADPAPAPSAGQQDFHQPPPRSVMTSFKRKAESQLAPVAAEGPEAVAASAAAGAAAAEAPASAPSGTADKSGSAGTAQAAAALSLLAAGSGASDVSAAAFPQEPESAPSAAPPEIAATNGSASEATPMDVDAAEQPDLPSTVAPAAVAATPAAACEPALEGLPVEPTAAAAQGGGLPAKVPASDVLARQGTGEQVGTPAQAAASAPPASAEAAEVPTPVIQAFAAADQLVYHQPRPSTCPPLFKQPAGNGR